MANQQDSDPSARSCDDSHEIAASLSASSGLGQIMTQIRADDLTLSLLPSLHPLTLFFFFFLLLFFYELRLKFRLIKTY